MEHIKLISLAGIAALFCSCSRATSTAKAASSAPAVPVKMALVQTQTVPIELKAIGNVEALTTISVKAQITGALMKTNFTEGAMVRQGEVLFEIDARPYREAVRQWEANLGRDRALLAQAQANLQRAQAQQSHAETQLARYEKLAAEGILSREQAEQTALEARTRRSSAQAEAAAVESARASIAASEASLENARLNLAYCTIRSPITGRTGSISVKEGNLVKANDVDLVTIHQIAPAYVTFTVPEDKLVMLRRRLSGGAMSVSASIPDDNRPDVRGMISFLDNSVDMETGTIRLKATFANSDGRLWPGQFVNVRVLLEERADAAVIPASALQTGQNGSFVYVVKADSAVELRLVKAGPVAGRLITIEQGLQSGERVITEGHLRIAPGVKVRAAL